MGIDGGLNIKKGFCVSGERCGHKKIIGKNRRTITCTLTPSTMANFRSASRTQSLVFLPSWLLNMLGAGDVKERKRDRYLMLDGDKQRLLYIAKI